MTRILRLSFLLFPLVCGCARCGSKGPPADWIARVESFAGQVTATTGAQPPKPVEQGLHLRIGDRLQTGPTGQAVLLLRSKRTLRVKPSSVVLFRAKDAAGLSLALEQGSVTASSSKVQAAELMIAVGGKQIRLASGAEATVATGKDGEEARIGVTLGEATVEGPGGETQTISTGQELVLAIGDRPKEPDTGPPPAPDAGVEPPVKAYFLQAIGRGVVMVKAPGDKRFRRLRRGKWEEIPPGTIIRLLRGAKARFGKEKDASGSMLAGPGVLKVKEQPEAGGSPLEHVQGDIVLSHSGPPGSKGSSFTIEGVTITPGVRYQDVDVRIRGKGNRKQVVVNAGQAELKGKGDNAVVLEAGQETTIHDGTIGQPRMPPQAPFQIRQMGTVRVFTSDPQLPVTFKWKLEDGADRALIQVSRVPSMASPMFSDIIKRKVLTIPEVRRGTLYWRVTPVDASGRPGEAKKGRLLLVQDTSYRVLKDYHPPRNTIHESFGNTTVFYQNQLPRFAFRWNPMEGAASYTLKIFREQNLQKPLVNTKTNRAQLKLGAGKLGEGTYIWYVVGRSRTDELVRALKGRKLTVRYDNATPDLQIVSPRNGITVGEATIETRGVTIPGSKVFVDNKEAELDRGFRFTHNVALKPGVNYIFFRVVAKRRGSSIYLRRVTRK